MIAALKGRIHASSPGRAELDCGGGLIFNLQVPVSSFPRLALGQEVCLHTVLKIKDEDVYLYGFIDAREKQLFEKLLLVSGIGGKIAMACISGFSASDLAAAIDSQDVARISAIPGIGKKTAQRMILELTGKLEFGREADAGERQLREELVSGLVNLGFAVKAAREAVERILKEHPELRSFEPLFRLLLKRVNR